MSERNAKMKKLQEENEVLKMSETIKDRLIIEFVAVCTAQKLPIPKHIIKIIETLYPGKLAILKLIDEVIENDEKSRNEKENETKKEKTKLSIVE